MADDRASSSLNAKTASLSQIDNEARRHHADKIASNAQQIALARQRRKFRETVSSSNSPVGSGSLDEIFDHLATLKDSVESQLRLLLTQCNTAAADGSSHAQ